MQLFVECEHGSKDKAQKKTPILCRGRALCFQGVNNVLFGDIKPYFLYYLMISFLFHKKLRTIISGTGL